MTRVLLVDGNQEDRDYSSRCLRTSLRDSLVIHAASGQSALTLYRQEPIDCLVLELDLPDMSGFEVLFNVVRRVECPEIAVIVLTRLSHLYLLQLAITNGAQAALRKNITTGDMLELAVLKAMANMQQHRQLLIA